MKMNHIKKYWIPILFILVNTTCSDENNPVNPPLEKVLFSTSFEKNGQPSGDGWRITSGLANNFSTDAPDSGGSYSLVLEAGWNGGTAEIQIPALTQYSNYQLSFYSKFHHFEGRAFLSQIRDGNVISEKSVSIIDTTWIAYSLSANFSLMQGDSLKVTLYGGLTQLISGETYFDLCKLVAVD
jgi:hypothetical protein